MAMESDLTVVVGGGAAGLCAAISSARRGHPVVICEKNDQIGRKLLATGNGRCNLLNDNLTETHYNSAARPLVKSVFACFGKQEILGFFRELGLRTYSQDGRFFPVTNQAASVLKVLTMELERLKIPIEFGFECSSMAVSRSGISVVSKGGMEIRCARAVLTGGGKTYPAFGSNGSAYDIAKRLGHSIVEPVPSAVPLVVKDSLCHLLQGQRVQATVKPAVSGLEGGETKGELLFTKYGLSGTAILDASSPVSIAINRDRRRDVSLVIDMVPFMGTDELRVELQKRKDLGLAPEDMLAGILPNKFGFALRALFESGSVDTAVHGLKSRRINVSATRGWNEAEFTQGGIDVNQVRLATLESRLHRGLYFAGEVLDVDGERGGFNLGWAWASGWVAGAAE